MKTSPFNSFSLFRKRKPKPPTAKLKKEGTRSQINATEPLKENLAKTKDLPTGTLHQKKPPQLPQPTTPLFDNQDFLLEGTLSSQKQQHSTRPLPDQQFSQPSGSPESNAISSSSKQIIRKRHKPEQKSVFGQAFLISIILVFIIGSVLSLGYITFLYLHRPKLSPIATITFVPTVASSPTPQEFFTPTPLPEQLLIPSPTAFITPTSTPSSVCGQSGKLNILVIAYDGGNWVYPFGADAIRMVKIDFDNAKVNIFAFPRDLWVSTTPLNKYHIIEYRLGPSFSYIQQHEKNTVIAITAFSQIIEENFGISSDNYLVIHHPLMRNLIDSLGGLEITIPQSINDPALGLYLNQGFQKMNGLTVEKYMRFLKGHTTVDEWGRFSRQNEILMGLRQNFSKLDILKLVPQFFGQFNHLITTDLSMEQMISLACAANTITSEEIELSQIDRNSIQISPDGTMFLLNKQAVVDQLNTIFTK